MKWVFWSLFFAVTAAGMVIPFLPPGSWPWWDSTWIFVYFVAVYAGLAGSGGLAAARLCSGAVVILMAVILGLTGLTGWPLGPMKFTDHAGLQIGGTVPLVLPLLAFALLTTSESAASAAFPWSGRTAHSLATAGAFLITIVNGLRFFTWDRLWWVWNPEGAAGGTGRAVLALALLGFAALALAFVYPVETRMRETRWSSGTVAWLLVNALFLAANLAMLRV